MKTAALLKMPMTIVLVGVIGATTSACGGETAEVAAAEDQGLPPAEGDVPPSESPPESRPGVPPPPDTPPLPPDVPPLDEPEVPPEPVLADDAFNITLVLGSSVTPSQADALQSAARRWEEVIVRGLPDATVDRSILRSACGLSATADTVPIDDLVIVAATDAIDGPGQVLGQAGPCIARNDNGAPIVGVMIFDQADLEALESAGGLEAVLLHEMGHVLGIGTLWADRGLLENPSLPDTPDADTRFIGPRAAEIANTLVGSGDRVPVENGARPGSSDGHWRESVFRDELMTPFLDSLSGGAPLSALTVASLEDLGFYVTDPGAADPFTPPPPSPAALSFAPSTSPCRLIHPAAYVSP